MIVKRRNLKIVVIIIQAPVLFCCGLCLGCQSARPAACIRDDDTRDS